MQNTFKPSQDLENILNIPQYETSFFLYLRTSKLYNKKGLWSPSSEASLSTITNADLCVLESQPHSWTSRWLAIQRMSVLSKFQRYIDAKIRFSNLDKEELKTSFCLRNDLVSNIIQFWRHLCSNLLCCAGRAYSKCHCAKNVSI